jgi:hypothetical protein
MGGELVDAGSDALAIPVGSGLGYVAVDLRQLTGHPTIRLT